MSMDENPEDWPDEESEAREQIDGPSSVHDLAGDAITANTIAASALPLIAVKTAADAEKIQRLVDWTKAKAIWAAIVAAAVAGLLVLLTATDDDVITKQEWILFVIAVLGGSGATGITTYTVPNRAKPKETA